MPVRWTLSGCAMSELSAVEVIAGVIGNHRYSLMDVPVHRCVCGVDVGRDDGAMDDHRATEVDKALGGLTREAALSYSPPNDPDSATFHTDPVDIKALRTFLGSSVDVYRWVGGWTPEETP